MLSYGLTLSGPLYEDAQLRNALRETNSAVLQLRVSYITPPMTNVPVAAQVLRNAEVGGAMHCSPLMKRLADQQKTTEAISASTLMDGSAVFVPQR